MRFEADTTYQTFFPSDHKTKVTCKVLKRTEKTVTFDEEFEGVKTCKISIDDDGHEFFYPLGRYSMQPIMRARQAV